MFLGAVTVALLACAGAEPVAAQEGNLLLSYDEARFSVVNTGDVEVSLLGLAFVSRDAAMRVSRFESVSWEKEARSLAPGECVQLVYGLDREPLRPAGCERLRSWRATRLADQLFWHSDQADATFNVFQGSALLAVCPSRAGACAFELEARPKVILVSNLLFYYTPDLLVIFNDAANTAPSLEGMVLRTSAEAVALHEVDWQVKLAGWDRATLGSAQCLALYRGDAPPELLPVRCEVVAQARVEAALWLGRFEFVGSVLGRAATCPAARGDLASVCMVPQ